MGINADASMVLLVKLYGSNFKRDQKPGMLVSLIGKNEGVRCIFKRGTIPNLTNAKEGFQKLNEDMNISNRRGSRKRLPPVEESGNLSICCEEIFGFGPDGLEEKIEEFQSKRLILADLRALRNKNDFGTVSINITELYESFLDDFRLWKESMTKKASAGDKDTNNATQTQKRKRK